MSKIISGMMRIAEKSDAEIRDLFNEARGEGVNTFDHADIYGGGHVCERRFAQALGLTPAERDEIILQSKTGISLDPAMYDHSYEHVVREVEESLRSLQTDYLDVLLLHRPDALVEPDEVARAFDELEASGKVRSFGVSNHTPGQIQLLQTAVRQPLTVNQVQFSLAHANLVAEGMTCNSAGPALTGVVDHARLTGMTLQTWSPLSAHGKSFLGSNDYPELNAELDTLAREYGVAPAAVAVAWITRHPANFQVVLGSTTPAHFVQAAAGEDIQLTREQWYRLYRAAGYPLP